LAANRPVEEVGCDAEDESGMQQSELCVERPSVGDGEARYGGEDDGGVGEDHGHYEAQED